MLAEHFYGGDFMSTKDALTLLESISDDKKVFLDIARSYVADKLNLYYSVENTICLQEDDMIRFKELPEFEGLRQKIANIENAKSVIGDFFELDDDIAKINQYLEDDLLIAYMEVDDYDSDDTADGFSSSVMPSYDDDDSVSEAGSEDSIGAKTDNDVSDSAETAEKAESTDSSETSSEEQTETPSESTPEPDSSEETEERIVGIYKEEYDTSWAPEYEPDEDDYFLKQSESELLGDDEKPVFNQLFSDDVVKTEKDDILAEANSVIEQGNNFIFTGASPQVYLSKRFEYLRIKYALKNIEDGEDEESEIEIIKNELIKLRNYSQHGVIVSIQAISCDMNMVEKIYGLLKEFDPSLYPASAMPNIDDLLKLMGTTGDYDEKATKMHKFYMVDTINFLKTIYKNCSSLELDKKKRFAVEKDKLEDKHFEELQNLEREFYSVKTNVLNKNRVKAEKEAKKKALESEYNDQLRELESSIQAVVEKDTRMVGKNMKLYDRVDKMLRSNVMCFQAK